MSKKRKKQLVRIDAISTYSYGRQIRFKWSLGTIPYQGTVLVKPGEDVWDKIAESLDREDIPLLQQEREV